MDSSARRQRRQTAESRSVSRRTQEAYRRLCSARIQEGPLVVCMPNLHKCLGGLRVVRRLRGLDLPLMLKLMASSGLCMSSLQDRV